MVNSATVADPRTPSSLGVDFCYLNLKEVADSKPEMTREVAVLTHPIVVRSYERRVRSRPVLRCCQFEPSGLSLTRFSARYHGSRSDSLCHVLQKTSEEFSPVPTLRCHGHCPSISTNIDQLRKVRTTTSKPKIAIFLSAGSSATVRTTSARHEKFELQRQSLTQLMPVALIRAGQSYTV
jgi:hypothetical protein